MAAVIFSSTELSAQPLSSYHPIQLQKTLQFVLSFQKDSLEAIPPFCTLCNIIRRHWLTITMGIQEMSFIHLTLRHTEHPCLRNHGYMLWVRVYCIYYSLPATIGMQHKRLQDHHEGSPYHDLWMDLVKHQVVQKVSVTILAVCVT